MKENIFIKLLSSQNKPVPSKYFYCSFLQLLSICNKIHIPSFTLFSFEHHCKLWSISGTSEDSGLVLVLSEQQLCLNVITKLQELWPIKSQGIDFHWLLIILAKLKAYFLGQRRARSSAATAHQKVPLVGWITDTCFRRSQIQSPDLLCIIWRHTHYMVSNSWAPHMLGVPCIPPFLPLPFAFFVWPSYVNNRVSVSLQHFRLYASLRFFPSLIHLFCMIPPSVMLYPVLFCLLAVFLPFYFLLCFPSFIFSSFLTNWQEQASMMSA